MTPEENRPPLSPSDFAKILLNQVVGNSENPNNLSSANVLQLVRQGVSKPEFMQEYLKSEYSIGGNPPQYSVLTDSEYMDAYRTDQVPDLRPQPDNAIPPDNDPQPQPIPAVESLPTGGGSGYSTPQPYMPGDPNGPNYQNSLGPNRTDGLNPATGQPYPDFNFLNTLSNMGMQQQNGQANPGLYDSPPSLPSRPVPSRPSPFGSVSPPSVSEDLLQGNFQSPLPMYGPPPAQQGYNYNPDVMAKLLQKLSSTQM